MVDKDRYIGRVLPSLIEPISSINQQINRNQETSEGDFIKKINNFFAAHSNLTAMVVGCIFYDLKLK